MFCSKCGTQLDDNASFCSKCGAKIEIGNNTAEPTDTPSVSVDSQVANKESRPFMTQNISGHEVKKKKRKRVPLILCAVVLGIIAVITFVGGGNNNPSPSSESDTLSDPVTSSPNTSTSSVEFPLAVSTDAMKLFDEWAVDHPLIGDYHLDLISDDDVDDDGNKIFLFTLDNNGFGVFNMSIRKSDGYMEYISKYEKMSMDDWYAWWFEDADSEFYDNDAYLTGEDEYPPISLDTALCGRWRSSATGRVLDLGNTGVVNEVNFVIWTDSSITPNMVHWEASNGRLVFDSEIYKENVFEINQLESGKDELIIHRQYDDLKYHRTGDDAGSGIIGEWALVNGIYGYLKFNEDGTGMDQKYYCEWFTENAFLSRILHDKVAYDYYVSGDMLELFYSNGSEIFTKIGN